MEGNRKLGLTAEFAALIRSESGVDEFSQYFVTPFLELMVLLNRDILKGNREVMFI